MTETDKLNPCPFCGGKAYIFVDSDNDNPFASNDECNYYWQVKHNCNMPDDANHYFVDSDFLCFRTPWFKDRQKAIAAWNRRAVAESTTHAVTVSDESADCATGHCECELCGQPIDPWDRFCRWCGAKVVEPTTNDIGAEATDG